jgi:hypothetical protein
MMPKQLIVKGSYAYYGSDSTTDFEVWDISAPPTLIELYHMTPKAIVDRYENKRTYKTITGA